jgi:lipopolysaccharide biosynthesis glycosyltransferase
MELEIPQDSTYFNSGVLLINLKFWRENHLSSRLVDYVLKHRDELRFADQDALNAVCFNTWKLTDMTWNLIPLPIPDVSNWEESSLKEYVLANYDELRNNPAICHFSTKWKPWTPGFEPPFRKEWFNALKNSGWFSSGEFNYWLFKWNIKHYWKAFNRKILHRPE